MRIVLLFALTQLCLMLSSTAQAAIIIDFGNAVLQPNQANQIVPINVTSDTAIQGLNFSMQIDPGAFTLPTITAIDITGPGTVFSSNNTGAANPFAGDAGGPQLAVASTTTNAGTITPNGVLAFVTFDTTGIFTGTYTVEFLGTLNGDTDFAGVPATSFQNRSLSISAIPEPGTLALLAVSGVGYGWQRRRKFMGSRTAKANA